MTPRFIVIMLVIAAVLAGFVYWAGRPAPASVQASALLDLEPSSISGIDVRWVADGSLAATVRKTHDLTWVMEWRTGDSRESWPVLGSRVMSAARLLADVHGSPVDHREDLANPLWITLHAGDQRVELAAAKRSFGGRGVVVRTGEGIRPNVVAEVDGELVQVFQRVDVLAWRDVSVFPADMTGASRIEIATDASTTRAARVGGRWALVEPVRVRADVGRVEGMLAALKKLRVARFPADQAGWTPPAATGRPRRLVIETDRRTPDGGPESRWVLRQELVVDSSAGPAGDVSLARASVSVVRASGGAENLWGPTTMMIDGQTLDEVFRSPESLASPVATATVAADVRGIALNSGEWSVSATRSIDDWSDAGGPLTLARRDAVRTVINLLTAAPAIRVELGGTAAPPGDAVAVTLLGSQGPPLDTAQVYVRARGTGAGELVILTESVRRVFGPDALAAWEDAVSQLRAVMPAQ